MSIEQPQIRSTFNYTMILLHSVLSRHSLITAILSYSCRRENVDNDDGSCFYHTHDNFLVYGGQGMKNDFGGHDNHHCQSSLVSVQLDACLACVAVLAVRCVPNSCLKFVRPDTSSLVILGFPA